jgi:hypothetical protein
LENSWSYDYAGAQRERKPPLCRRSQARRIDCTTWVYLNLKNRGARLS